jgi:lipoate-protein ligase B
VEELGERGVSARWSDLHPGVWVGRRKIAAVGFHISRRISTHGFALNLAPDMRAYDAIVPCGLAGLGVTSLAQLGVAVPARADIAAGLARRLADRLGLELGRRLHPAAVCEEKVDVENVPANG